MNLQFSIIGYIVIAVFYVISSAILFLVWVRFERKRWVKPLLAVVVPIVAALPWAEEVWVAWNFAKSCDSAGVHVTRKAEVDGYYDDTGGGPSKVGVIENPQAIDVYESAGFRFREFKVGYGKRDKVSHVEKDVEGQWRVTILNSPEARYHYRFSNPTREVPVTWKLEKVERQIFDSHSSEVIAKDLVFKRFPNVIEWQWIRFFGTGMKICRGPLDEPEKQKRYGSLYEYALIPRRN